MTEMKLGAKFVIERTIQTQELTKIESRSTDVSSCWIYLSIKLRVNSSIFILFLHEKSGVLMSQEIIICTGKPTVRFGDVGLSHLKLKI